MSIAEQELIEAQAPVDPLKEEVSRILEGAAELIEKCGWYHGNKSDWGSTHCAGTSINEMAHRADPFRTKPLAFLAYRRLQNHLGLGIGYRIPFWNDAQTDARVVTRALREAAAS